MRERVGNEVVEYRIVLAEDGQSSTLERLVNEATADGWDPIGGVTVLPMSRGWGPVFQFASGGTNNGIDRTIDYLLAQSMVKVTGPGS